MIRMITIRIMMIQLLMMVEVVILGMMIAVIGRRGEEEIHLQEQDGEQNQAQSPKANRRA